MSGNTIGAFESHARWVVDGAFFSSEAAISMKMKTRDDDGNGGERDDGRAVVGGDATRDAREGTRGFFVCVVRSVVRAGGRTGRGRVATRAAFRRRPREISSRPSAGNAMMGTMTRAMDDDEDDED